MNPMNTAHERPASPRRRVLDVAGAVIAIEADRGDAARMAAFARGWADAGAPENAAVDRTLFVAEHLTTQDPGLRAAVFDAAREVLADRDVWAPEAALLVDGDRAVLVLGGAADAFSPGARHGDHVSLGRTLVAVDPLGTVRPCAAPVPTPDGIAAPSEIAGVPEAPARLRLAGILVPGEQATPVALETALPILAEAAAPFPAARDPLRSLARLIERVAVVSVRSPEEEHVRIAARRDASPRPGHREPPAAEPLPGGPGEDRLHRSGAIDALVTEGGHVIVLMAEGGRCAVLDTAESAVWTGVRGAVPEPEISAARARLLERGLLSTDGSWRIADDVAWADHGASTVALDLRTPGAAPLALRDSAQSVWHVLVRGRAVRRQSLLAELSAQYGVEPEVVADDVDALLASLERARLVVRP